MTDPTTTPDPHRHAPDEIDGRSRTRRIVVAGAGLLFLAAIVAGLTIRLPQYILSPGMARPTEPLISVEGAPTYEADGSVDFLTVSMRQATPLELFASWFNPALESHSREELFGVQSESENRAVNAQLMVDSKDAAQYQALERLGYSITSHGTGAVIATVGEGSPATGVLVPGDVVTAIDGAPIALNGELVARIAASAPGTTLRLAVEPFHPIEPGDTSRPGARTVEVTLGARPDDPTRAYLGVTTFTRDLTFDFPVSVQIDSGSVVGPSAGLAFTLGILDVLTPGSITGGQKIATTGTMSLDGTVGPIGGIHQKVVAARRKGVTLMLVPRSEYEDALRVAGDLRVEAVDTLDDALAVLATVGGGDAVLPPKGTKVAVN